MPDIVSQVLDDITQEVITYVSPSSSHEVMGEEQKQNSMLCL